MKIGRIREKDLETYGFVKDGLVVTKEEITFQTGVPLPFAIKDFLFEGWYEEIIKKQSEISYTKSVSHIRRFR